MGEFFMSKKQKKLMKERRRKKKLAAKGLLMMGSSDSATVADGTKAPPSKKRPLPSNRHKDGVVETEEYALDNLHQKEQQQQQQKQKSIVITVPPNLTSKQAKKFRKEERRKARASGMDDSKLQFTTTKNEDESAAADDDEPPTKKKKVKRSFPCINDLVRQEKMESQQAAKATAESDLSDEYKAKYVALDCEMVGIGSKGRQSALARVSMTNWDGETLLDTFVQVPVTVTDFRTFVSGVKPKHIQQHNNAMEVSKCRETVAALLKDKILVGHALKNDLHALMLQHPVHNIRDTAKYRPFQRLGGKKWRPRKLRDLVAENGLAAIQVPGAAHDSVQDAVATMELFKTVHAAWEKEIELKAAKQNKQHKR